MKQMREEGFEPSHRMIVGLKSTALDHSAIRAYEQFTDIFGSFAQMRVRTADLRLIRPML